METAASADCRFSTFVALLHEWVHQACTCAVNLRTSLPTKFGCKAGVVISPSPGQTFVHAKDSPIFLDMGAEDAADRAPVFAINRGGHQVGLGCVLAGNVPVCLEWPGDPVMTRRSVALIWGLTTQSGHSGVSRSANRDGPRAFSPWCRSADPGRHPARSAASDRNPGRPGHADTPPTSATWVWICGA